MAAYHQRTPTFSFSDAGPAAAGGGIGEDDLLRAQRLLGGGLGDGAGGCCYRRAWDEEPGLPRRLHGPGAHAPAPAMARFREEMMEMVRRSGSGKGGPPEPPVVYYELSLRDIVELPSAAKALRDSAAAAAAADEQDQASEKPQQPPVLDDEEEEADSGMRKAASRKEKERENPGKVGRKRDAFRGQRALESGVVMLKMFFVLPAGVFGRGGGSSGRQRRKELTAAAAVAASKVTPAPKAAWGDEDRSVEEDAWEDCQHDRDRPAGKQASRSSSGNGEESVNSSPGRSRRRFPGCYSLLHMTKRRGD